MRNRKIKTRMKEHIQDIKYKGTTALARLQNIESLKINYKNSKMIYQSRFHSPSITR